MSLVLRSNINRRLTVQEMDGNFTYLENLAQTGELTGGEPSGRKRAVYKVIGQSYLGFAVVQERFNNTGIEFTFQKDEESPGFFTIPEFNDINHKLIATVSKQNRECKWLTEDQKLVTYNPTTNDFVDDAFEFGGWIEIEVLTPLP